MAIEKITIQQFVELADQFPVLDVRSPGEYLNGHVPGAYSLPLFDDEERKIVGTAYKQESKQKAIKEGLKFFGVKMAQMVEEAERIVDADSLKKIAGRSVEKEVIVYCWRGGMRSAGIAWLLDLYGFKVYTLIGGYKSFRRWCTEQFEKQYDFRIIGGYTGSGKTDLLKTLKLSGNSVIDIEALANHKGSAFGHLGQNPQPTQEMFENKLAKALFAALSQNSIWLEDESQRIGTVNIPPVLYAYMRTRPVYFLEIPFGERLKYISAKYGMFKKEELAECIIRIGNRLGGKETKSALECLQTGDVYNCFKILLKYYDKYYLKCLERKKDEVLFLKRIQLEDPDAIRNAGSILAMEGKQETRLEVGY